MNSLTAVVRQLKNARLYAQREIHRIDAALEALGSPSSKQGRRHGMSAAARRKISLAQESTLGKAEGQATPHNVRCSAQENRSSATCTLGKGEEEQGCCLNWYPRKA
jgi:hypothetical protein